MVKHGEIGCNSGEIAVTSSKTGCKCNVMEILSPWSLMGHWFPVSISFNHLEFHWLDHPSVPSMLFRTHTQLEI